MKSSFDKLNLRPNERRMVVFVAVVAFAALNYWFVFPLFKDWRIYRSKLTAARDTLRRFQLEMDRVPAYQARLDHLQSAGADVASAEAAVQLQRIVQQQAVATGVTVTSFDPRPRNRGVSTNQFFDEETLTIRVSTGTKELVDFLVNIASSPTMIRVRDLDLRPDPSQFKLGGTVVLVASYQKQPGSAKAAPVAARRKKP